MVFYEHSTLFLLELLFQGYHQYAQFRGYFTSFVHASFAEQKLVFYSNIQFSVQHAVHMVQTNTMVVIDYINYYCL